MISQTDATLSAATTTTSHHLQHILQQQQEPQLHHIPTTTTTHNGKGAKTFCTKKRKKFEETIVDGFAIIAFRTWEDLQDELNSNSGSNNTNTNSPANANPFTDSNNLTADNKKAPIKASSKNSTSSSCSSTASTASSTANSELAKSTGKEVGATKEAKKKDRTKKSSSQSKSHSSQKDKQRNRSSSEKNSLRKALEAKELAEKRLSILQEKLKQEKSKNRATTNTSNPVNAIPETTKETGVGPNNDTINGSINHHHHHPHQDIAVPPQQARKAPALQDVHFSTNSQTVTSTHHIIKEEIHHSQIRSNGIPLPPDLLADPNLSPAKSSPFPTYLPSTHPPRPYPTNLHQSIYNPPSPSSRLPQINQAPQAPRQLPKHLLQPQHSSTNPPSAHPLMNQQHQSTPPPPAPLVPQLAPSHQMHPQYLRSPHPGLMHQPMPYPQVQQNSMMSMGLGSLPSPYSCPPSIYITDTFSRQTSIIPPPPPPQPPPVLGSVLDTATSSQGNRFGHSSVVHSIAPYNPPVPPHHPMYYPTLPTERSFLEFARSYTGPGHVGYPNLMNSFPTSNPANPYSFDRWPRVVLDQQRAANRYNSLYQSAASLPDRAYPNYTARPPSFPASLFPPPF